MGFWFVATLQLHNCVDNSYRYTVTHTFVAIHSHMFILGEFILMMCSYYDIRVS